MRCEVSAGNDNEVEIYQKIIQISMSIKLTTNAGKVLMTMVNLEKLKGFSPYLIPDTSYPIPHTSYPIPHT